MPQEGSGEEEGYPYLHWVTPLVFCARRMDRGMPQEGGAAKERSVAQVTKHRWGVTSGVKGLTLAQVVCVCVFW